MFTQAFASLCFRIVSYALKFLPVLRWIWRINIFSLNTALPYKEYRLLLWDQLYPCNFYRTVKRYFKTQHTNKYLLTHSTQHSPSWEANRFAVSQEFPCILWNPKVHYRIHKCPPTISILSQLSQSISPYLTSLRSALMLFSHLRLGLPSCLCPSGSPTKTLHTTLPSRIRGTFTNHIIIVDLITRTIVGKE
jgi:hypothetical protein